MSKKKKVYDKKQFDADLLEAGKDAVIVLKGHLYDSDTKIAVDAAKAIIKELTSEGKGSKGTQVLIQLNTERIQEGLQEARNVTNGGDIGELQDNTT